jgi:hypothetical protein
MPIWSNWVVLSQTGFPKNWWLAGSPEYRSPTLRVNLIRYHDLFYHCVLLRPKSIGSVMEK